MSGAEAVWELLSPTQRSSLCQHFSLTPERVSSALRADGIRLAQAGEKLFGLVIVDCTPVAGYIGEHVGFFASNLVLSAFLTDLLQLPADGRPGVNASKLSDLFLCCLALTAQRSSVRQQQQQQQQQQAPQFGVGTVFNFDGESSQRARSHGRRVIEWTLRGKALGSVSIEDLKLSVQERVKSVESERHLRDLDARNSSLSVVEFNEQFLAPRLLRMQQQSAVGSWPASLQQAPPPQAKQPLVQLRYMTRSGQERTVVAHLCCGAMDPRDCHCPQPADGAFPSTSASLFASSSTAPPLVVPGFEPMIKLDFATGTTTTATVGSSASNVNDGSSSSSPVEHYMAKAMQQRQAMDKQVRASSSSSSSSVEPRQQQKMQQQLLPPMARFHVGKIDEVRLTKTKASKTQSIAVWTCCGADCAKASTAPLGYEVIAERDNGCCSSSGGGGGTQ